MCAPLGCLDLLAAVSQFKLVQMTNLFVVNMSLSNDNYEVYLDQSKFLYYYHNHLELFSLGKCPDCLTLSSLDQPSAF